jgi:DNA-binding XRE family transcriptional regulator
MNIIVKNKLKDILNQKGIKHIWLAEELNVSKATISNILNNKQQPSIETTYKIAILLNLEIDDIFFYKKV